MLTHFSKMSRNIGVLRIRDEGYKILIMQCLAGEITESCARGEI